MGALDALRSEGKIRHIGVCNVTVDELAVARATTEVATVQHRLDLTNETWRDMLTECERHGLGFIPYRPLRAWDDSARRQVLAAAASRHNASTNQVALAWLLAVSSVTLPIPGTSTTAHLEENNAAGELQLDQDELDAITSVVSSPPA